MENAPSNNEASSGTSALSAGLERMFRVEKFDHPDLVGGIVWADCELAWINERITLAILAEREACAMECEAQAEEPECPDRAQYCADSIRMRSNAQNQGTP